MAVRSLRSMVRMAVRAETFSSSPGIYGLRNALSHVHSSRMVDAALSGFVRSRGIHIHSRRDVITGHADVAFTALTVTAFSVLARVWYWMKDTDKPVLMGGEDPFMKTDAYLRKQKANAEVKRAIESYNEAVVEDMDDDPAMRARFEDWIKEYGRTYKDEVEKARRFKIFKAFARSVDVNNAVAAEIGSNVKYGLTDFADWNSQEHSSLCCSRIKRD